MECSGDSSEMFLGECRQGKSMKVRKGKGARKKFRSFAVASQEQFGSMSGRCVFPEAGPSSCTQNAYGASNSRKHI